MADALCPEATETHLMVAQAVDKAITRDGKIIIECETAKEAADFVICGVKHGLFARGFLAEPDFDRKITLRVMAHDVAITLQDATRLFAMGLLAAGVSKDTMY